MPKPKRKRSAPRSAASPIPDEKPFVISPVAREEAHAIHVTRRLLHAMQELDALDKFRLAAVVMWIRSVWCGDSKVLFETDVALKMIDAMTDREMKTALDLARDQNLRAAVTA